MIGAIVALLVSTSRGRREAETRSTHLATRDAIRRRQHEADLRQQSELDGRRRRGWVSHREWVTRAEADAFAQAVDQQAEVRAMTRAALREAMRGHEQGVLA